MPKIVYTKVFCFLYLKHHFSLFQINTCFLFEIGFLSMLLKIEDICIYIKWSNPLTASLITHNFVNLVIFEIFLQKFTPFVSINEIHREKWQEKQTLVLHFFFSAPQWLSVKSHNYKLPRLVLRLIRKALHCLIEAASISTFTWNKIFRPAKCCVIEFKLAVEVVV